MSLSSRGRPCSRVRADCARSTMRCQNTTSSIVYSSRPDGFWRSNLQQETRRVLHKLSFLTSCAKVQVSHTVTVSSNCVDVVLTSLIALGVWSPLSASHRPSQPPSESFPGACNQDVNVTPAGLHTPLQMVHPGKRVDSNLFLYL